MAGAELVNLDELVPGIAGVEFKYRDQTYHVPGDLDTETVLEFLALYQTLMENATEATKLDASEMTEAEQLQKAEELRAQMKSSMDVVREKLLAVFRLSDPDLKSLPFGQQTTMIVLGKVLEMMGVAAPADTEDGDLPVPPTKRVPQDRKPKAPRKKATTSTTR